MEAGTKNFKLFHLLSEELEGYLKNLQGLFVDSLLGYRLIGKALVKEQNFLKRVLQDPEITSEKFQNTVSFSHEQLFGEQMPTVGLFFHKKGEVKERVKNGGSNQHYIVFAVIVTLCVYWEDYFREKVAKAYRKKKIEYKHNFWGDLRLLRNTLVHKNKETADRFRKESNTEFFREIAQKEMIILTPEIMQRIFLLAYAFKNSLFYESLPKNTIKISNYQH
jgi:hypothetical protein